MLDLNCLARDPCCQRFVGAGAKDFGCMLLHARFVLGRRVFDHLRVSCEGVKRRQNRQHDGFGTNPLGQGDAVLDGLPGQFRPVCRY